MIEGYNYNYICTYKYIYKIMCTEQLAPRTLTLAYRLPACMHEKSMHAGAHLIGASNNVDLYPLTPATII